MGWGRLGGTTPATCAGLLGAAPELGAAPATSLAEPGEATEASELGVGSESQGNSVKLGVWHSRADFHPKLLNLSAQFSPRLYCGKDQTRSCLGPGPRVTRLERLGLNSLLSCLKAMRPWLPVYLAVIAWHTRVVGLLQLAVVLVKVVRLLTL